MSYSRGDQFYSSIDRASFGAPRECFNNVVGPNNFNYKPFKASDPGPGKYGTGSNPFLDVMNKS